MAKIKKEQKKKKLDDEFEEKESYLKTETTQGILAILFFVLGIFFILSGFQKSGKVGLIVFKIFEKLFGYGFWLIPLIFILLSASFFNSLKKKLALTHSIGGLLFFVSTLSILNIFTEKMSGLGKGGFIGGFISTPLTSLFDIYASVIILLSFIVISILIMFDIPLKISFQNIFFKKEDSLKTIDEDKEIILNPETKKALEESKENKEIKTEKPKEVKEKQTSDFEPLLGRVTLAGKEFIPPPLNLLEKDKGKPEVGDIKANSNIIKRTLANFGINVEMDEVSIGPSITRYALKPAEGVKLSKIVSLQNDISLALAAHPIRIEAPIPGKSLVGIEIPNSSKTKVRLGSLLSNPEFQESDKPLFFCLGKGISGHSYFANLAKAPHMLIAGSTGSGKSVTIHAVITSLLYRNSPDNLKFIMVDPKRVELTLYNKIPHLLTPVITDAKKTIMALKWAAKEMDRRYDILQANSLQNISSYHEKIVEPAIKKAKSDKNAKMDGIETMPYIVIVIDELADIMQAYPRELESGIVRLAQMSRAVGIHLILSTQRPSVNVITGLIKANIPSRIALQVASQIDSRTILDMSGAEKLLGAGDMLYLSGEMSQPQRIQSAYLSEDELKSVVNYLASNYQNELPESIDLSPNSNINTENNPIFSSDVTSDENEEDDDLYEEARMTVIQAGKASTSFLQRKLGIGYARAARLIDILEERSVIGPGSGAKPRDVLIKPEDNIGQQTETA